MIEIKVTIEKELIEQVFVFMNKKFGLFLHETKGLRFVMSNLDETELELICAECYFNNLLYYLTNTEKFYIHKHKCN